MRIWDVSPNHLCRAHLLGEHRELHGLWNILTKGRHGYAAHPETVRWQGKLHALFLRHEALVEEMTQRGYQHASPLESTLATGSPIQTEFLNTLDEQYTLLRAKPCACPLKP